LQKADEAGLRTILARAAEIGITDLQAEVLIKALHDATGIGKRPIKAAWKIFQEKAAKDKEAFEAEERMRRAAEFHARRREAQDAERARLWASCSWIAESPNLLAGMEVLAHELGVVGEGAGVRAIYLTASSGLLVGEAIRLLRTGASASGKNYLVEKVLRFIPKHAVIRISGASPKAIAYHGGDDPAALQYRVLYVPEARILNQKPGDTTITSSPPC
jgi:hypothetical protein